MTLASLAFHPYRPLPVIPRHDRLDRDLDFGRLRRCRGCRVVGSCTNRVRTCCWMGLGGTPYMTGTKDH
jgi:hypothetical protein